MNPAMDSFHVVVRQVDLARPDALVKVSEFGRLFTLVYWWTRSLRDAGEKWRD